MKTPCALKTLPSAASLAATAEGASCAFWCCWACWGVAGWLAVAFVIPMLTADQNVDERTAVVIPTIRDDMAAHTVTIPGEDGQRITIRELRTSAIVTGGVATFDILDHVWYDNL